LLEKIQGTVRKIVFQNNENNYYIIKAELESKKNVTILGSGSQPILCNDIIIADGSFVTKVYKNKKQEQFKANYIKKVKPQNRETILEYLSSGIIKGIGKKTAQQIVSIWGEESLDIIDSKPHLLTRVSGIGTQKLSKIINSWDEVRPQNEEITQLIDLGFNSNEAIKIYKCFREKSIEAVKDTPYLLYNKVRTINFDKIDAIALNNGFNPIDEFRVQTALEFITINEHRQTGFSALTRSLILDKTEKKLKISKDIIDQIFENCISKSIFYSHYVNNEEIIQHNTVHDAETEIAQKIFYLYNNTSYYKKYLPIKTIKQIKREGEKIIPFSDEQNDAILKCINNKISILTGKPGTGKTTVLNEIVKQLKHQGKDKILLCAPTGKAAQKMKDSTGMDAYTIHRLLDYNPIRDRFEKNINNPLNTDVLIIDEASMIDIFLMANLIRAIHDNTQLIIAGDVNQLPSIGCGSVLRDMIDSKVIPVSRLTQIKRTANSGEDSKIITTAHEICDYGKFNVFSKKEKESDLYFINTTSDQSSVDILKTIVNEKVEETFKMDKFKDLQILTPIHSGLVGSVNINNIAQELINKNDEDEYTIRHNNFNYKKNDKVIQIINNYDKDVFNGDSGIISSIDNGLVTVLFEDKEVSYKKNELREIAPSYCLSIHKSQGSEYPLVIIMIPQEVNGIMERSLIYTAITRSKNYAIIIGSRDVINHSCENDKSRFRKTILKNKLKELFS
tara:strand:+ start:1468 stop:3663 length:2196 start_codon:yes stop_codon:yes gene_type:complete